MELSGVYLAASASRPNPHPAARRTDCTAADPGSAGSTAWKDTCTPCCRDERKRGSPSAKSCVRCPLLFSRTTELPVIESILNRQFLDRGKHISLNLSQFVARQIERRRGLFPLRCRAHRLYRRRPLRGLLVPMATNFDLLQTAIN